MLLFPELCGALPWHLTAKALVHPRGQSLWGIFGERSTISPEISAFPCQKHSSILFCVTVTQVLCVDRLIIKTVVPTLILYQCRVFYFVCVFLSFVIIV